MPLPFACLSSSSTTAAEDRTSSTDGDPTAPPPPPPPPPLRTLQLSSSTASDSSSSSDGPAVTSSSADDSASLVTLPSIHSLAHCILDPHPFSASFLCLSSLQTAGGAAAAVAVSAPTLLLYIASAAEISVYDLASFRRLDSFPAAPAAGSVKSVAFSADGRAFTAHQDGLIRAWRRSTRSGRHRLVASLPTAADRLRRLPLPSNYITVRRHKKLLWIQHADAVSALAAGGGLLYSVSWDKTLKVWRASDLRCIESVAAHDDAVNAVAVAADGTVYTGSADRRIRVWARSPGERRHGLVATLERHRSAVNALAVSGDGATLYSGACDRSILVWEREDSANHMAVAGALRGHRKAILCLACAGDLVFSGSSDRTVRIWRRGGEGRAYSCLGVLEGHGSGVRSLAAVLLPPPPPPAEAVAEEEYRVCSGSLDGEVRVWRVRVWKHKGVEAKQVLV
ncbi:protein JINGUBANG-like [Phoenix dactylifera]|uniref:Protein JINGUBANG-like n=1 Tax=Phoenix dactylifera TaxID=42345 RepID=A0A8B9AJG1_PHODC|nr:protein JINGUBANG-like [Phoenix dactylifera]